MEKTTVLVTGVGGGAVGEQILKALRLSEKKYRIVGTDVTVNSTGLMNVDIPIIIHPAKHPDFIHTLTSICKKYDVKIIFPGSEPELKAISSNRRMFQEQDVFLPLNPQSVIDTCSDKNLFAKILKQNNIPVPHTEGVSTMAELENITTLPAVLKPSTESSGSVNVFIAQTKNELLSFGKYMLNLYPKITVQEYIGTVDSEYTVGVLSTMDGELINSIAVRRNILSTLSNKIKLVNKTPRKELGEYLAISTGISQGTIGRFPEVTEYCEKIAKKLGACSSINIQCRLFEDKLYIFEINPRFSGTTSLRAMVGFNEPDIMIRNQLFGEKFEKHFTYGSGTIMRGITEYFIHPKKVSDFTQK